MKETFPDKKKGEHLHHEKDWNKTTRTVQRLANQLPGSNQSGIHTGSFSGAIGYNPWHQYTVEISDRIESEGDIVDGLYMCKLRYYDHTETEEESKWKSRETEWLLDSRDLDLGLELGTKLVVWWNSQRQSFMPCGIDNLPAFADFASICDCQTMDVFESASGSANGIFFRLERSTDQEDWFTFGPVGEGTCNISSSANMDMTTSGNMFYSLLAKEDTYLRIRAWHRMTWAEARIKYCFIKIEVWPTDYYKDFSSFWQNVDFPATPQWPNNVIVDAWFHDIVANQPGTSRGAEQTQGDYQTLGGIDTTFRKRPIISIANWEIPDDIFTNPQGDTIKITIPPKIDNVSYDKKWLVKVSVHMSFVLDQAGDCLQPQNIGLRPPSDNSKKYALIVDTDNCLGWMPIGPC